ncbi:hypothetical protein [Rhodococcus sp. A14]|uniref:hypothetical protein n=1 Tax=Rhodococcus sp. A14 TaxID=1194106 RepID=UPI001423C749|nr:hypothetical protein [Rhodococcus sp. A14]
MADHEELVARHTATISAFVIRARRVAAHSLAADPHALIGLAEVTLGVTTDGDGRTHLNWSVPPEESVESAAARVRPLILKSEAVHYSKVLAALGYLLHGRDLPRINEGLDTLKAEWGNIEEGRSHVRAYAVVTNRSSISDVALGFAWIYGDVVHADPERIARTEEQGVEERYKAAVPLVAQLMINTIATLSFIQQLVELEHLVLPGDPFDRTVAVTRTEFIVPVENAIQTSSLATDLSNLDTVVQIPMTLDGIQEVWRQKQAGTPEGSVGTPDG